MPKRKVKVKTTPEEVGDLTIASHKYTKFRERDEEDTTPEPEGAWSEWRKKKNAHKRVTTHSTEDNPWTELDPNGAIREVDRGFLFDQNHPPRQDFTPGKTKF